MELEGLILSVDDERSQQGLAQAWIFSFVLKRPYFYYHLENMENVMKIVLFISNKNLWQNIKKKILKNTVNFYKLINMILK